MDQEPGGTSDMVAKKGKNLSANSLTRGAIKVEKLLRRPDALFCTPLPTNSGIARSGSHGKGKSCVAQVATTTPGRSESREKKRGKAAGLSVVSLEGMIGIAAFAAAFV